MLAPTFRDMWPPNYRCSAQDRFRIRAQYRYLFNSVFAYNDSYLCARCGVATRYYSRTQYRSAKGIRGPDYVCGSEKRSRLRRKSITLQGQWTQTSLIWSKWATFCSIMKGDSELAGVFPDGHDTGIFISAGTMTLRADDARRAVYRHKLSINANFEAWASAMFPLIPLYPDRLSRRESLIAQTTRIRSPQSLDTLSFH